MSQAGKAIRDKVFGTPRELFRVVHDLHGEFTPWDVGATWSTLHRIVRNKGRVFRDGKDVKVTEKDCDLLLRTTTGVLGHMNAQDVANTLWAMVSLGEHGVHVDPAAIHAVSAEAPRVAGDMNAYDVSMTLLAWGGENVEP